MNNAFITIAMDGGAASGKSTTSRRLADRLHLMHVDTGSHYRAITHYLVGEGVATEEVAAKQALEAVSLETEIQGNRALIRLGGKTPEAADLRSDAVNAQVSAFAALPSVRAYLFHYQRGQCDVARGLDFSGIIMEGRDIGSVILPDADLRVFLEADAQTRAARRQAEGQSDSVTTRDKLDSSRKTAPLTCPEGALRIDTGKYSVEEVVDLIVQALDK